MRTREELLEALPGFMRSTGRPALLEIETQMDTNIDVYRQFKTTMAAQRLPT
ncbi:MAG: hypothetical protein IPK16_00570 [Anaerolineales bacterium]|nr:hypothetical protein [Anaerolineales bacterium]